MFWLTMAAVAQLGHGAAITVAGAFGGLSLISICASRLCAPFATVRTPLASG